MNYEVKVSYCLGLEGAEKKHTENLFIRCELFAEAEEKAYKYVESQGGDMTDVKAIKRSNVTELIEEEIPDARWHKVTISKKYIINEETEKETEMKYYLLLMAENTAEANERAIEHMKQVMYDYSITKIEETKFSEVI